MVMVTMASEEEMIEWIHSNYIMTDEEREQCERVMAAYREHLSFSQSIPQATSVE